MDNTIHEALNVEEKLRKILELSKSLHHVDSPLIQNYATLLRGETEGVLLMFALEDEAGPLLHK